MRTHSPRRAFSLLELLISLVIVSALLAILLPTLTSARIASHRADCAGHQIALSEAWHLWLEANDQRFPVIYDEPGWFYGGLRFSAINGSPFLDFDRPLNRYVPRSSLVRHGEQMFQCPADTGIRGEVAEAGTGSQSAYRAFGTSYRANAALLRPTSSAPVGQEAGLSLSQITTPPSRLVVMGDAVWFEVRQRTGRQAQWHATPDAGNLLFLDGSVRFVTIEPEPALGPAVFDPFLPQFARDTPADG